MALTNILLPDEFTAAYRPIPFRFTSDISPDSETRPIVDIRIITPTELINNPQLGIDTVIVDIDNGGGPLVIADGQHIKITGSVEYSGVWRQIVGVGPNSIAITAPYTVDETPTATIEKFYNNFSAVLNVDDELNEEILRTSTRVGFNFDIKTNIQAIVSSSLQIGAGSNTATDITDEFLQEIKVTWAEQYDIPDANGINVLTLQSFNIALLSQFVLNTAPKVIGRGYDYNDGLDDFTMIALAGDKRFLTEQPDITIGTSENYQLTFFTAGISDISALQINYFYYDSSGSQVGLTTKAFTINAPDSAFSVNVGTVLQPVLSNAAYYTVEVFSGLIPAKISEVLRFNVDYNCNIEDKRFYWLNNMGGFDAHTFKGNSSESTKSVSTTIFNENIDKTIDIQNDAEYKKVFVDTQDNRKANSGNVSADVADWLTGIVKSTQVYLEEDGVIVPVIIVSNSAGGSNTKDKKFSLNIDYRLAYKEVTING